MQIDGTTITTVLAVLIPAGSALASYAVLRERVNRHDRSIENLGARMGKVEQEQAATRSELSRPIHPGTPVR
jgi:hypothetical protein